MLRKAVLAGFSLFVIALIAAPVSPQVVVAVGGNIEPDHTFAWGENVGWINFKPSEGPGVTVSADGLTGYAWGENIGWITFDPKCADGSPCGGVQNDGAGNLSGYAWGENVGWINFAPSKDGVNVGGVTIGGDGRFHGAAWGENIGWISFDYTGSDTSGVVTSWHPASGPAVITLLGSSPVSVEMGTTFSDPGATAVDSVGNNLTSSIVVSGAVDTSALGTYTITYSVTDANGLTATVTRTVNVVDTIAPAITASASVGGTPYTPGTWVNSDVLVTFACTDSGSGVESLTPVTVSTEGANQSVKGTCKDKAGQLGRPRPGTESDSCRASCPLDDGECNPVLNLPQRQQDAQLAKWRRVRPDVFPVAFQRVTILSPSAICSSIVSFTSGNALRYIVISSR